MASAYPLGPVAAASATLAVAFLAYRAIHATGFYWQDDYRHLLISKLAWHQAAAILDVWGRPLMTLAYMPAVLVGTLAVRGTSLLLVSATAVLCWLIARERGSRLAPLAALLFLAEPLTATLGYAALPETVFSFLLAGALYLRARERPAAAALLASLLPLARLEGVVVIALWALWLVLERRPRLVVLLPAGLLMWAFTGAVVHGDVLWLLHANPNGLLGSEYPSVSVRHVFSLLPLALGTPVVALAAAAYAVRPLCDRFPLAVLTALFAFYLLAFTLPAFNTEADGRYLVSLSVPAALCATEALGALGSPGRIRPWLLLVPMAVAILSSSGAAVVVAVAVGVTLLLVPGRWPAGTNLVLTAAVVVAVVAATAWGLALTQPLTLDAVPLLARRAVSQLGPEVRRVGLSTTPVFTWFADQQLASSGPKQLKPGQLLVWDSDVGSYSYPLPYLHRLGFRMIRADLNATGHGVRVFERFPGRG